MTVPQRTVLTGLLGISLLGGCAGLPWQDTGSSSPTPAEASDNVSTPAIETPLEREDPPPALVIPQDSVGLAEAIADSAADVSILDQLATVLPPTGDPSDTSLEAFTESGGLDLRTYADHPRVQFYIDFFFPEGTRIEETEERMIQAEEMVASMEGVVHVINMIGGECDR